MYTYRTYTENLKITVEAHKASATDTEITSSVSRPNESAGEETEPEIAQESGMDVGDSKGEAVELSISSST